MRFGMALWAVFFWVIGLFLGQEAKGQCTPVTAGTYLIGQPQGQFTSLEQALEALRCGGSTGAVTLQLLPGTYAGHYVLDSLPGSTQHLLTLRGGAAVNLVRPAEALVAGSISVRGGRWRLEALNLLRNTVSRTAAPLITISGGMVHSLVNNRFVATVNDQRPLALAIQATGIDSLRIDSNIFVGWHRGLRTSSGNGLRFAGNTVSDYTGTFFEAEQWQGIHIHANNFSDARQLMPLLQAFYLTEVSGLQFWANTFVGTLPQHVLRLERPLQGSASENRVFNNEINGHWQAESTGNAALFWFDARQRTQNLEVLAIHNSIRLQGNRAGSESAALRLTGWRLASDSLLFANNLLAVEAVPGTNVPLPFLVHADTLRLAGVGLFNNAYARPDSNQAFWLAASSTALSFAQWRNQLGYDGGSVWGNPLWRQPDSNLIPSQSTFNGAAFALPWPLIDITGFGRSSPPDPGAREFEVLQRELRLGELHLTATSCGPPARQRAGFTVHNVGTEVYQQLPVRLLRNGQSVSFMRLAQLPAATSITAFFPDSVLVGGNAAVLLEARIDTIADNFSINDTMRLLVPATQPAFPAVYAFDNIAPGSLTPGLPWTQRQGVNSFWQVNVGANVPHIVADANGNAAGRYLLLTDKTTQTLGQPDSVELEWDCLSLQGLGIPELSFQYHRASSGAVLRVMVKQSGQWQLLQQIAPGTTALSTHEWWHRRILLPAAAEGVRLSLFVPAGSRPYWAIDQLQLGESVIEDLQLDSVLVQFPACQNSGELLLTGFVRNSSLGVVNILRLGGRLGNQPAVFATANRILLPLSADTIQLRIPYNQAGNQPLQLFSANHMDVFFVNDTLQFPITIRGTITQYPYTDDFESPSAWSTGGNRSSWQRAIPEANRLNQAGSGQRAWVTAPLGQPNVAERSWLQSPCLNLSGLLRPRLEFLLWYDLGPEGRAWVEYEAAPGIWSTLGAAYSGTQWYNAPGMQPAWRGSSGGWIAVSHDLDVMQGLTSASLRIVYQAPGDSLLQVQPIEGIAIDRMRIFESPGSFVATWQAAAENCTPISRQVTATVARASQLQQIDLRYRVNGGTEQVVPMTTSGGNYVASIPAQAAGAWVSYRIQTQSDTLLSTPVRWYTDAYFGQQLADVSGPSRLPVTLDAGVSAGGDLPLATGANDTAAGAWVEIEALRYAEIEGVWVQPTAFTTVRVFGQVAAASGDSLRLNQLAPLGSIEGIGPGGSFYILFTNRPAMRPGQKLILYVESAIPGSLRVSKSGLPALSQDASIAVRPGRWYAQGRGVSAGVGMPVMRVVSRNPAFNVRWSNMQGTQLSSQPVFTQPIGLTTQMLQLRLDRPNCVYLDTVALIPTGQFDLAVTQILEPQLPQVQQGVFYPVKVVLTNRGNLTVNEAQLAYRVNGAELAVSSLNRSLAPNDTMHFTFPQLWTWVEGNSIVMCAYPRSFNLDVLRNNDTSCVVRFPTSVEEKGDLGLKIYPQPAQGEVVVEFTSTLPASSRWQLFDALGREVRSEIFEAAEQRFSVTLHDLPNGLYYYHLQSDKALYSGKLLIGR